MVSSESKLEWLLTSALATFVEPEALLDEDLPDNNLPDDLLEGGVPDLEFALDAFSSCSCLSV
jgi:hypothetical protein